MYKVIFFRTMPTHEVVLYAYWYEEPTNGDAMDFITSFGVDPTYVGWKAEWVGDV